MIYCFIKGIASITFSGESKPQTSSNNTQTKTTTAVQTPASNQNIRNSSQLTTVSISEKCNKCNKPLSGATVEAAGGIYHQNCFGCEGCGMKLSRCVNVGNKVLIYYYYYYFNLIKSY